MSLPLWTDNAKIKDSLVSQGWKSPDTYGQEYDVPGEFSAVYLFLLTDTETFQRGFVAYVGMSRRLLSRWRSHNVLPVLSASPYWPQRWFKPVQARDLRPTEAEYIKRFDPPWNINGRIKGVVFQ